MTLRFRSVALVLCMAAATPSQIYSVKQRRCLLCKAHLPLCFSISFFSLPVIPKTNSTLRTNVLLLCLQGISLLSSSVAHANVLRSNRATSTMYGRLQTSVTITNLLWATALLSFDKPIFSPPSCSGFNYTTRQSQLWGRQEILHSHSLATAPTLWLIRLHENVMLEPSTTPKARWPFCFEKIDISVIANKEDLKGKMEVNLLTNHDYRLVNLHQDQL